jgi:hypothetical protein
MENNLTASEQLAQLQPTAVPPPSQETLRANIESFVPPSVSGARADLNQIQNLIREAEANRISARMEREPGVSPFAPGLSASQLFARDRAEQDRLIGEAYARAGIPLDSVAFRNVQQQLRSGEITGENIQDRVVNPLLEQRVANAYKAIGRTGPIVPLADIQAAGTMPDAFKSVDREGYDYWLNQLKSGQISGDQFQNVFLSSAATPPSGPNAALSLDATNRARAALGLSALTEQDLAGYVAPPPPRPTTASFGVWNPTQNQNPITNILGGIRTPAPAPAPSPAPGAAVTPYNFFAPAPGAPTQLF